MGVLPAQFFLGIGRSRRQREFHAKAQFVMQEKCKACLTHGKHALHKCTKLLLRMGLSIVGYTIGLLLLNSLYAEHSPYRYALILLPVLPLLYLAAMIIRSVSEMDEMRRKIVCEAMA